MLVQLHKNRVLLHAILIFFFEDAKTVILQDSIPAKNLDVFEIQMIHTI